jgi:hypothetical protein
VPRRRVNGHVSGFINNHKVVILIDDGEGDLLRNEGWGRGGGRHVDDNYITDLRFMTWLYLSAVYGDAPFLNQLLDIGTGEFSA